MEQRRPTRFLVTALVLFWAVGICVAQEGAQDGSSGSSDGTSLPAGASELLKSPGALRQAQALMARDGKGESTDVLGSQDDVAEVTDQVEEDEEKDPEAKDQDEEELPIFGMNLFEHNLGKVRDPLVPVNEDYLIGPGDVLIVRFWNDHADSSALEIEVDRNGKLALPPKMGDLDVGGLSFGDCKELIKKRISRTMATPVVSVSMGALRSINVWLAGAVEQPGYHSVSSFATVFNGLLLAGGPRENGSLRAIELKRQGEVVSTVDLYDFLLKGDRTADIRLREGDVIFVPPRGPQVRIDGEIKFPAFYELRGETSLKQALDIAGGFTGKSFQAFVQLERTDEGRRRVLRDFDLGDASQDISQVTVQDGDAIHVGSVVEGVSNHVVLEGNVERPGEYAWFKGMTLSDLLSRGGPVLPQTYLARGEVFREHGAESSFQHGDGPAQGVQSHQILTFNVLEVLEGNPEHDLRLRRLDRVVFYHRDDVVPRPTVTVQGAVRRPGVIELTSGMRVSDLLFQAGGLEHDALLEFASLVRRELDHSDATGVTRIEIELGRALEGDLGCDILLQNFDLLIVRRRALNIVKVKVEGSVQHAGNYFLEKGARVSDLLGECGGPTDRAFLEGAVFARQSIREQMEKAKVDYVRKQRERLLQIEARASVKAVGAAEKAKVHEALAIQNQLLADLEKTEVTGRLPLKGMRAPSFVGSAFDVELRDGDSLFIPEEPAAVHVVGQVAVQGATLYVPGQKLDFYLGRVGGLQDDADEDAILIVKADGDVVRRHDSHAPGIDWDPELGMFVEGRIRSLSIERGDLILVPPVADVVSGWDITKDIVDILFKTAVAAGVVIGALD